MAFYLTDAAREIFTAIHLHFGNNFFKYFDTWVWALSDLTDR